MELNKEDRVLELKISSSPKLVLLLSTWSDRYCPPIFPGYFYCAPVPPRDLKERLPSPVGVSFCSTQSGVEPSPRPFVQSTGDVEQRHLLAAVYLGPAHLASRGSRPRP